MNGELVSEFYSVKDQDDIRILDYYTLKQVLEFMDIIYYGNISVNNVPAQMDTKVYDNFTIRCNVEEQIPSTYVAETFVSEEPIEIEEDLEEEAEFEPEEDAIQPEPDFGSVSRDSSQQETSFRSGDRESSTKNIAVIVNGENVVLRNKADYIFVDILDFYPFDTSVAHGDHLELRVNGVKCDFTHPVKEGDQIQIEWVG